MKTKIIYFMMFVISSLFLSTTLFAQVYPHIPVEHDHSGGICWGYAVARAFQYKGHVNSECAAGTVKNIFYPNQSIL